ncbi:uncharacterized protein LOC124433398 [Xenia sp. Carnegie-2017]|uniref:uncharacterized protein LOC124433398 n=1 Tax=Xenia sp. Carnegie-2017 TaxID=2897299 RepID=UPI001F040C69|nr:uncharacterized protein LOC124433398 [Xenia sp. Carnegie-2017]
MTIVHKSRTPEDMHHYYQVDITRERSEELSKSFIIENFYNESYLGFCDPGLSCLTYLLKVGRERLKIETTTMALLRSKRVHHIVDIERVQRLDRKQRIVYFNAVIRASTVPIYKGKYERLLTIHKTIFHGYGIHTKKFFLPWHRWYLLQYENLLREIEPEVIVPYWDWSLESGTPTKVNCGIQTSQVLVVMDHPQQCVLKKEHSVKVNGFYLSETKEHYKFFEFEQLLREYLHDTVHCEIGGTMCTHNAAFAPEFFLHHAFIDKIWWDWQRKGEEFKKHYYFMEQTSYMPWNKYLPKEFIDSEMLPNVAGKVCVEYQQPIKSMPSVLKGKTPEEIIDILSSEEKEVTRLPLPKLPLSSRKLFRISSSDNFRLKKLLKVLQPSKPPVLELLEKNVESFPNLESLLGTKKRASDVLISYGFV